MADTPFSTRLRQTGKIYKDTAARKERTAQAEAITSSRIYSTGNTEPVASFAASDPIFELRELLVEANVERDGGMEEIRHNPEDGDLMFDVKTTSMEDCLRFWALETNQTHSALNKLLKILRAKTSYNLPKDARTILKTPSRKAKVVEIDGGKLWYNGINNCIQNRCRTVDLNTSTMSLNISIDGLPLHNSTKMQFWPILFTIAELPNVSPMPAAIYCGLKKPEYVEQYLRPLVKELNEVMLNGIQLQDKAISIRVLAFIADTPARAFIKGVVNFNGLQGCLKCVAEGQRVNNRTVFRGVGAEKRTDAAFRQGAYWPNHQKQLTPLLDLQHFDMIDDVIIADRLHLIDLGVTKKLLKRWKTGESGMPGKMTMRNWDDISLALEEMRLPSEIRRHLRSLEHLDFWKGNECRTFLHYASVVVLRGRLSDAEYAHFMLYFCAVTMLSSDAYKIHWPKAKQLLDQFVVDYETVLGVNGLTSNVHNLQHVYDDVARFGNLGIISSYPYENHLGHIKDLLRHGYRNLEQAINRLAELDHLYHCLASSNTRYPELKVNGDVIKLCVRSGLTLKNDHRDGWFLTTCNRVAQMRLAVTKNGDMLVKGRKIMISKEAFYKPVSSFAINISIGNMNNLSEGEEEYLISNIKCKLARVQIDAGGNFLFIPLMHTLKQ